MGLKVVGHVWVEWLNDGFGILDWDEGQDGLKYVRNDQSGAIKFLNLFLIESDYLIVIFLLKLILSLVDFLLHFIDFLIQFLNDLTNFWTEIKDILCELGSILVGK